IGMPKRDRTPALCVRESKSYLLLVIIILLWGINFVVARVLSGIDPIRVSGILYAFFRYFLGSLTMIVVMVVQKRKIKEITEGVSTHLRMLFFSALFSAIFVIAIHTSAEFIPSGTTSIIVNLSPIVVLIFGILFLGELLTPGKVVGFLLGVGAGLIFLWTTLNISSGLEWGILLAIIGMLAWGAYTVTLHYLEGVDPYIVMTIKHGTSTLMILPFIFLLVLDGVELILVWDLWTVLGLIFAGVLASGLAYVLYFTAIEILGAARASSFLFLIPFVSVAGDFVLGEPPHIISLFAGAVAIVGVALVKMASGEESPND
ncbi:MAG: DMT family transporter, partial [Candidatus Thorarchaeota archaeon]|nr:DMT family transporter [Candidatus Thorarchaeota archaeon]